MLIHILSERFFLILDLFPVQNSFNMANAVKWLLDFVEAL